MSARRLWVLVSTLPPGESALACGIERKQEQEASSDEDARRERFLAIKRQREEAGA